MAEKEDDLGKPRNTDALHHDPINQQIQGTNNHKRKKNNITRSL